MLTLPRPQHEPTRRTSKTCRHFGSHDGRQRVRHPVHRERNITKDATSTHPSLFVGLGKLWHLVSLHQHPRLVGNVVRLIVLQLQQIPHEKGRINGARISTRKIFLARFNEILTTNAGHIRELIAMSPPISTSATTQCRLCILIAELAKGQSLLLLWALGPVLERGCIRTPLRARSQGPHNGTGRAIGSGCRGLLL